MSKRLEILRKSLEKKQAEFDRKLNTHIAAVKERIRIFASVYNPLNEVLNNK